MNSKANKNYKPSSEAAFGHAIVIGSGIAGLTAARILTDFFSQVTIVERDHLPDSPEVRRGVPQAHHAHALPLRGQKLLEKKFPGLTDELINQGAVAVHGGSEMAFFVAGEWHQMRHNSAVVSFTSSRPLLENILYHRVAAHPRVRIIQEHGVEGLTVDRRKKHVTGVRLRRRGGLSAQEITIAADLVIDTSGRDSQAPQWLAEWGFMPPQETIINAFAGYSSRIYRRPVEFEGGWKTLYVRSTPHHSTRGGVIIPIEGDRWHVTLHGMAGDHPPTSEAGFLAFAQSLPTPHFYEAICAAEPLTEPRGYRRTENRMRHYEQLPHYLEGFLVCGDAAYTLNPVHAMGMTAAVSGSLALENTLAAQAAWPRGNDLTGLSSAFQKRLSQVMAELWTMTTQQDRRWPMVEVIEQVDLARRQRQQAAARIMQIKGRKRENTASGPRLVPAFR